MRQLQLKNLSLCLAQYFEIRAHTTQRTETACEKIKDRNIWWTTSHNTKFEQLYPFDYDEIRG